jgi:hypothetical protein
MPMSAFFTRCLQTAMRETRTVTFPAPMHGVPAGEFVLHEFYCDEPGCDCRRVILKICEGADVRMDRPAATVHFGWESVAFYKAWLKGDDEQMAREMTGVSLEEMSRQGPDADAFVDFVRWLLKNEPSLVERFQRHYQEFKSAAPDPKPKPGGKGGKQRKTR